MDKITFVEFKQIMSLDLNKKIDPCIEINFYVDGCLQYEDSWLGKMIDRDTKRDVYWFGLTYGGLEAYEFDSFEKFVDAKVFYGSKSLKEIWNLISITSLGGGSVEEMLPYFLGIE